MSLKGHDVQSHRLEREQYAQGFCDLNAPLNLKEALAESARCHFCYDAPCITACPTGINIPEFIRGIQTRDLRGAAKEILDANILGGTCARVCPVETLCENACVRNHETESKPVLIGRLQRYATDWQMDHAEVPLFERAPPTGKRVAVVGAGPAGLSCAHRLSRLGHEVEIFEARPKAGGLNEYGIAAYKMAGDFAQRELQFILSIGGIKIHTDQALGKTIQLDELRGRFDAVFLGLGLGGVQALKLDGETLHQVRNAVDFIAELRQARDLSELPIGRRVVVIGGGNTAIDAAIQAKRLGAEEVTLVYRRGPESMGATHHEQELALRNGVVIRHWARPARIEGDGNGVSQIIFERTKQELNGSVKKLLGTGDYFQVPVDMVLKAVGQVFVPGALGKSADVLEITDGKISVNARRETTLKNVFAGGDCIDSGEDLTVVAVQDGKLAAFAIDERLTGRTHPWPT